MGGAVAETVEVVGIEEACFHGRLSSSANARASVKTEAVLSCVSKKYKNIKCIDTALRGQGKESQ